MAHFASNALAGVLIVGAALLAIALVLGGMTPMNAALPQGQAAISKINPGSG